MDRSAVRSRWAAFGAAIAVTLGAGGIGIGHATSPSGASAYVPITPCRLADTRPAPNAVGARTTGIGPGETYTLDGWGAAGDCNLPTGTTGLALNVTAVGATEQTNLRFFPAGAAVPTAANLNPTPGAPPTPNAVDVGLRPTDGKFSVFNKFGVVAVVIDVVGYYTDHHHDDRYYQKSETYSKAEVDALLAPFTNSVAAFAGGDSDTPLTGTAAVYQSVSLMPPADGKVIVTASAYIYGNTGDTVARCSISLTDDLDVASYQYIDFTGSGPNPSEIVSGTRGFDVTEGDVLTVNFVCLGAGNVADPTLTAIFAPN